MVLNSFLMENRASILRDWKGLLLEAYPEDSRRFFEKEKDHFANPVGNILLTELERLLKLIIEEKQGSEMDECLDRIIRIRAVQDIRPSEAIGFIFHLKDLIRRHVDPSRVEQKEITEMDHVIDSIGLRALDIYCNIKRQLQDLRVAELRRQYERLLIRAKLMAEIPDQGPVTQ